MNLNGMKKFMNALKTANIKNWEIVTAIGTHLYNNDYGVTVLDDSAETVYNFSGSTCNSSAYIPGTDIVLKGANLAEVHEVRFGGTFSEMQKFIEAYGISLDEDQTKILINIYGSNYKLKPQTGDYLVFKELTEDEIAALTPEQKSDYMRAFEAYKKRNSFNGPAQITV